MLKCKPKISFLFVSICFSIFSLLYTKETAGTARKTETVASIYKYAPHFPLRSSVCSFIPLTLSKIFCFYEK